METQPVKPLGQKGYGTIPHLPGSRRGPGDKGVNEGQFRICCVKTPPDRKGDVVYIQEKLDGCLHSAQPVMTDRGEIHVSTIVEKQLPVQVLTYNEAFGIAEYKPIVAYFRQIRERPWLCVVVRSRITGSQPRRVVCTDNHRFYRQGEWVEARALQPGDHIGHLADQLDGEARQIILGGLLGDSAIVRIGKNPTRGFTFGHSQPQWEYFEFKLRLLGHLMREIPGCRGGFPGSKPNRRAMSLFGPAVTDLILGLCETARKKQVSREWLDAMLPLGLAIWYMDDGSCTFPLTQRPRAHLAINAFSEMAAGWLSEMLQNRFGIANGVFDYKGCTLVLTADGTDRFFQIIYPYVPACMKHKLPEKYRDRPCVFDGIPSPTTHRGLVDTEVLAVTDELPARCRPTRFQYDLAVADNHNYFAGHVLVHNSNVGVARVGGEIIAINRAGWRVESSSYVHHQLFGEWVAWNRDRFDQLLEEGERVMGEWLVLAHGTKYDLPHEPFVPFDLIRNGWDRALTAEFYQRIAQVDAPFSGPRLLHQGGPLPLEAALALLDAPVEPGAPHHGPVDAPEGVVYRIERQGRVDFLAKFVRPEKVDGRYLFELDAAGQVRLPPVELPRSRFTWNQWPGKDDPEHPYAAWVWAYR